MVLKRERFEEIGRFDPAQKRRHDIDMWLRMIHNRRWCYDPIATLAYRHDTPGSISRAKEEALYYMAKALIKNESLYENTIMHTWICNISFLGVLKANVFAPKFLKTFDYSPLNDKLSKSQKAVAKISRLFPSFFKLAGKTRLLHS